MYTKTGNLRLVQKINRSLALNLIKDKGPISRADISKITKLTRSTVSNIVEYLIKKDLIKETGLTSSGVGRKAILLELNSKAYYSIGVDLGTLHTTIVITDLLGRIEKRIEYPTNCQQDKDKVIKKIINYHCHCLNTYFYCFASNKKVLYQRYYGKGTKELDPEMYSFLSS